MGRGLTKCWLGCAGSGGGVDVLYHKGGGLQMNSTTFSGNTAAENGGALSLQNLCSVDIIASNFTNNTGKGLGGAISASNRSTATCAAASNSKVRFFVAVLIWCILLNCKRVAVLCMSLTSLWASAGWQTDKCISLPQAFLLTSAAFSNNSAASGGGLAVSASPSASVLLASSHFDSNTARVGGGVYSDSAAVSITAESSFTANSVTQDGGAVICDRCARLAVDSSGFAGNTAAHGRGGALR